MYNSRHWFFEFYQSGPNQGASKTQTTGQPKPSRRQWHREETKLNNQFFLYSQMRATSRRRRSQQSSRNDDPPTPIEAATPSLLFVLQEVNNHNLPTITEDASFRKRGADDSASIRRGIRAVLPRQRIHVGFPQSILCVLLCVLTVNFAWMILYAGTSLEQETSSSSFLFYNNNRRRAMTSIPKETDSSFTYDSVRVVIVSDRFAGIVPTVSSLLTHTHSVGIDLVLIGDPTINAKVEQHFAQTNTTARHQLQSFTALTLQDITLQLEQNGHVPIWTWPSWGTSRSDPESWFRPASTIHTADWDNLPTHAHELNHVRFYLPHLFANDTLLYFMDDDILVRKDIGVLAAKTLQKQQQAKMGMVTPCNIWMWETTCQTFAFRNADEVGTILNMPSLYGDRHVCRSATERHCYPEGYRDFLQAQLPPRQDRDPIQQKAWNFGFTLMILDNWRDEGLTERYEAVMRESYRNHVFPETSLTFGLGVAYLALAGSVACWDDALVAVRDGFGFIEYDRYAKQFGPDFMATSVDVIHYTGPDKPWASNTTIDRLSLEPWLHYMRQEEMPIPPQLTDEPTTDVFVLLASERTGGEWLMTELDQHPHICASGEHGKPESGFPSNALLPSGLEWLPQCSIKRACSLEYIENAVLDLRDTMDRRGRTAVVPLRCQHPDPFTDPLGEHLDRVCNFIRALGGDITEDSIERLWLDAFRREDNSLIGCGCPRGTQTKGLKVQMEWLVPSGFPNTTTAGPAPLSLTSLNQTKIIRLQRTNIVERYLSTVLAEKSAIYHPRSYEEKLQQLEKVDNLTISIPEMLSTLDRMGAVDREADRWARSNGSSVLSVDYDECRSDASTCWDTIHRFLGLALPSSSTRSYATTTRSLLRPPLAKTIGLVSNLDEVKAALREYGYEEHIAHFN